MNRTWIGWEAFYETRRQLIRDNCYYCYILDTIYCDCFDFIVKISMKTSFILRLKINVENTIDAVPLKWMNENNKKRLRFRFYLRSLVDGLNTQFLPFWWCVFRFYISTYFALKCSWNHFVTSSRFFFFLFRFIHLR